MPQVAPELKKYLEKRVSIQLNGSRRVQGLVRGYDVFLNIVLEEAVEITKTDKRIQMGTCVIRGNSVVMIEALERIDDGRGGGGGGRR